MDRHYLINYKPNSNDSFSLVTNNYDMNEREIIKKNKKKKVSLGNEKRVVKLSTDPQSVAARERRHRISERFKILQSLVPGGTKMDTASMLEEAIQYVKFLKAQIWLHQAMINFVDDHHDEVKCHDHHLHHVPSSDQQYDLSSHENDYLVMTKMYGHTCFYGHDQCHHEDTMSFDTSINYI